MKTMQRRGWLPMSAAVAAVLLLAAPRASQAETLNEAVDQLSKQVADYLAANGQEKVVLGKFQAPAGVSGMVVLQKKLMDALKESGIERSRRRGMRIDADLTLAEEGDGTLVLIEASMRDSRGKHVHTYRKRVLTSQVEIAEVLGLTLPNAGAQASVIDQTPADPNAGTPPAGTPPATNPPATVPPAGTPPGEAGTAVLPRPGGGIPSDSINKPGFFPQGTTVAAAENSPYRVEILLETPSGLKPLPVEESEGRAFVDLGIGSSYRVRIINDSDFDAAVRLSLDGINCFEFSEVPAFKALGIWIVRAKSDLVISGWYVNQGTRDRFTVVPGENSVAAGFGADQASIGTITCTFFAAWSPDQPKPPIEPAGSRGRGTGIGRRISGERESTAVRFIGRTLQSAVSIRYDRPDPTDLPLE